MLKIGLCAGHSHYTAGKRSPDGKIREWDINNVVVLSFMEQMNKYANVKLYRYDDKKGNADVPLNTRTSKANKDKVDVYVSFHHNASGNGWSKTATGTEIWVQKTCADSSESVRLAKKLAPIVAKAYGLKNRGVKKGNLAITRQTKMPSILIEGGFMNSRIDYPVLKDKAILKKVGVEIAKGVADFYNLKLKPTPKPATPKPATTSTATSTYVVQKGDTLYGISKKLNVSVSKIKTANGLKDSTLQIGQKLKIPAKTHKVAKGETLWGIATKYGMTISELKKLNGLKDDVLSIGQVLKVE